MAHHAVMLPDTPYTLWADGTLPEHLRIPTDGFRVEIVNGEIVVSPAPAVDHNGIVADIQESLTAIKIVNPSFPWRYIHSTDLNLVQIQDGYVPDLIVLAADVLEPAGCPGSSGFPAGGSTPATGPADTNPRPPKLSVS